MLQKTNMIIVVLNKKRRLYVRKICVHNRVRQRYGQGLWSSANKANVKKATKEVRRKNKAHNYLWGTKVIIVPIMSVLVVVVNSC